jgi:peptidyl-prolyl cis-trans isomerase D
MVLDKAKVRQGLSATEQERRKYYQDHLDEYRLPERVSARHILLRANREDQAKVDEARKKADELLKQLRAGADFGELAKKNSQDPGTASKGGDLGWIVRGQTVPAFENAAFTLAPGALSEPIQTEYGIHILKVAAHENARLRPLEEVQEEIDKTLLETKLQNSMSAAAEAAAAEWRRAPDNAAAIAAKYNGTMTEANVAHLPGSGALIEDIFLLEKNQIGRPVDTSDGYSIPMLLDVIASRAAEFSEVKEQVRTDFINEEANERLQAKAMELAQTVEKQEKRDLAAAARSLGLTAKTTEPLLRSGSIPSVGSVSDLGPQLDTLEPGQTAGPVPLTAGQIVYQLESRQAPEEAEFGVKRDAIRQQVLGQKQAMAFRIFQDNLKNRLRASGDLTINDEVLESMNTVVPR